MIRILRYGEVPANEIFSRAVPAVNVEETVAAILAAVRERGDEALRFYTEKFDRAHLDSFAVSPGEIEEALRETDPAFLRVLRRAAENIRRFHEKQVRPGFIQNEGGVVTG